MLQVQGLKYSIGERALLDGVDWALPPGRRFALIGPNGSGKTTLLRILIGEIEPQAGAVARPRLYSIGYLPQEEIVVGEGTVLENALGGVPEIQDLERRIFKLHAALDADPENGGLLDQLGPLEQRFQDLGGYTKEAEAKKILSGLGFAPERLRADFQELSGGWCMRVFMARLLLQEPDLLLLDEPTNHLDLPSLEWLEQYLVGYKGGVVVVSHDRYFIDRLAHEIYELDRGALTRYRGNYSDYEQRKQESIRLLFKRREEQITEKERITRFINKYRSDKRRASQVQSRIRMLDKIEEVKLPPPPPRLDFQLRVDTPGYKDVLSIEDLSFRYERDWVLEGLNLHISRGEKIAMVGVNGAGKTTLTRLIGGEIEAQKGRLRLGSRTHAGYYAQHQIQALHLDNTVYDEVASTAATGLVTRIRQVLGIFQFGEEDIDKPIRVLSGGEKARVSLAKILLSPVNFLIMDEPTTHLDITAREALEEALAGYDGTLLLISHDRYFLDKLVGRTLELTNGNLTEYCGNYSYYLWKRRQGADTPACEPDEPEAVPEGEAPPEDKAGFGRKSKERKRQEAEARQAVSRERRRLQKLIDDNEREIEGSETRLKAIEEDLARPETYRDGSSVSRLNKEYAGLKQRVARLYKDWEALRLELDELLASLDDPPA